MDVASGTPFPVVLGVSGGAVLVGTLAHEACLVGEAGPDVFGEAAGGDRSFCPGDKCERGTVWGPGQRWLVSWIVSLSRAVFWENKQTDHQVKLHWRQNP